MSYPFHADERIATGVCRIALRKIEKAIGEIDDAELNRDETIHQVRKRCKMLRGLIRLARPSMEKTYQIENNAFRDAARTLSDIRKQLLHTSLKRGSFLFAEDTHAFARRIRSYWRIWSRRSE